MSNSPRIVILGGGVAGLSAAHELCERGFSVEVYEKKEIPGGKARSVDVPGSATGGRRPLPGEHGFRFFPGFYRHLPDTLARIPGARTGTVADHLISVPTMTFAFAGREPMVLPTHVPRSWKDVKRVAAFFQGVGEMGLTADDLLFAWWKLWRVLTSCQERRLREYEPQTWWSFVDADARSQAFRDLLVVGLTRNLVASRAEKANARTVAQVGLQFLRDLVTPGRTADRILDGPTNDVWIDPWLRHLRGRGVAYHTGWELDRLELGADGTVQAALLSRFERAESAVANTLAGAREDRLGVDRAGAEAHARRRALEQKRVTGDIFLLALPVEVMAKLLARQPEILLAAPGLRHLPELGTNVEWMNGIQFYLTEDVPIADGHINHVDSPWALTTISQSQFWPAFPARGFGDGTVKTVVSVDISAWDRVGSHGKEAWDSTPREVAEETWRQLKASLNQGREVLRDDMLHPTCPWHIDANIDERLDKQDDAVIPHGRRRRRAEARRAAQRDGEPDLLTNAEPLLVNLADTWRLRPDVTVGDKNLFVASDYVRTETNLASMEAANEAARAATNAILKATGSAAAPAAVFPPVEPFAGLRDRDARRLAAGRAWRNPLWVDALFILAAAMLSFGMRAISLVAATPPRLYLLGAAGAGGFWAVARSFDAVWAWLGRVACELLALTPHGFSAAYCAAGPPPPPSPAGASLFWFGLYAIGFGLSLYAIPPPMLKRLGFPREVGPWMPVMAAMPVIVGTLYLLAAIFDFRAFFWATVFARVGVFLVVLSLKYGRAQAPALLLVAAVPDLAGACWTAVALSPSYAAALTLILGLANVVAAVAFRLFPERGLRGLGFPEHSGAWVPMAATLVFFWGVYEVLAALAGFVPFFVGSVLARAGFGLACVIAPIVFRARLGPEPTLRSWRLVLVGLAYLATAGALGGVLWRGL